MTKFDNFWGNYNGFTNSEPLTNEMIQVAERILGYKLPSSYIELLRSKNGGTPINTAFPTTEANSWADDHIQISGFRGIGGRGGIDSEYEISNDEDWGYPIHLGFIICECPSGGHDAVMLDYSLCGKDGEPRVIHVDVEIDEEPTITLLAPHVEAFVSGLVHEDSFDL